MRQFNKSMINFQCKVTSKEGHMIIIAISFIRSRIRIFIVQVGPDYSQTQPRKKKENQLFKSLGYLQGSRDISLNIFFLLPVCKNSEMTFIDNFRSSYFEFFKSEVRTEGKKNRAVLYLQITADTQANPCIFWQRTETNLNPLKIRGKKFFGRKSSLRISWGTLGIRTECHTKYRLLNC